MKIYIFAFAVLVLSFGVNSSFAYQNIVVEQNVKDTIDATNSNGNAQALGSKSDLGIDVIEKVTVNLSRETGTNIKATIVINEYNSDSYNNSDKTNGWIVIPINEDCSTWSNRFYTPTLTDAPTDYTFNFIDNSLKLCREGNPLTEELEGVFLTSGKYYQLIVTGGNYFNWHGSDIENYINGECGIGNNAQPNCGTIDDLYFILEGINYHPKTIIQQNIKDSETTARRIFTQTLGTGIEGNFNSLEFSYRSIVEGSSQNIDVKISCWESEIEWSNAHNSEDGTCIHEDRLNFTGGVFTQTGTTFNTYTRDSTQIADGEPIGFFVPDKFYELRILYTSGQASTGQRLVLEGSSANNYSLGKCYYNTQIAGEDPSLGGKVCDIPDIYFIIKASPSPFHSQIQNSSTLSLRESYDTNSTLIRTLPEGWVVKVLETTNDSGNNIEQDGYRWYKVQDPTDGQEGYMAAVNLSDGTIYLDYDENAQDDLEAKTELQETKSLRIPIIEDAVDDYMDSLNTGDSIYNTGGGDGSNNFAGFISDESFPRELFLGIISQESGIINFNNEGCSFADDGGIGIMQITSPGFKGLGSGLVDETKRAKNTGDCYGPSTSEYYSNSTQGIYANIKDGFRTLQAKHNQTLSIMPKWFINPCPITISSETITCADLKKILTTWGYNGFGKDTSGNYYNYLGAVANKLSGLSTDFSNINTTTANDLKNKLSLANKNKQMIKLNSPGELKVIDSSGNETGIVSGTEETEIPVSIYDVDNKGVAIFFPDSTYKYQVVGTGAGEYGLAIDFNDNSDTTQSFESKSVPMSQDLVHQYEIDWAKLASSDPDAVTISVDEENDGIFDYSFTTGESTLDDQTSPTTSISLSGTAGNNGWYTSDVTVSLSATDNTSGVGVHKTEYSLDNGSTWIEYVSPFTITNESATNTVQYRSIDYVGNVETTNTETIKIDKTPPEAKITFNGSNHDLKIIGFDNLSSTTSTQTTDIHENSYTVRDNAGNSLEIRLSIIPTGYTTPTSGKGFFREVKINSLQYNFDPIINFNNSWDYSYVINPLGQKFFEQHISVLGQFDIKSSFQELSDSTEIVINQNGAITHINEPGSVKLDLKTQAGTLNFEY